MKILSISQADKVPVQFQVKFCSSILRKLGKGGGGRGKE